MRDDATARFWTRPAYVAVFLAGLAWTLALWLRSQGALFDDEIGHFLLARDVFHDPGNLLDLWGRPVNTLTFALPALFGLRWARLLSIALSAATVLLASGLAGRLGLRRLYLVPAFLWFQPWYGDLGYCVITEVPFALWLAAGTYLWSAGSLSAASFFFGLLPLTRHEGIALTGLWIVYLAARREWKAAAVAIGPMAVFNVAYFAAQGSKAFGIYLNSKPTGFYGHGDWLHFLGGTIYQAGKPIFALALVGAVPLLRRGRRWLFFVAPVVYFAIHTVIYRFGLYASGGYTMFLLPVAPAIAVAAAIGFEWLIEAGRAAAARWEPGGRAFRWAAPAATALLVCLVAAYAVHRTSPHGITPQSAAMREASEWLKREGLGDRPIVSTNVNFYYVHPLPVRPGHYWWMVPDPGTISPGTIVVWDRNYSDRWGLTLASLSDPARGWRRLAAFGPGDFVVIFEKAPVQASTLRGAPVAAGGGPALHCGASASADEKRRSAKGTA